MQPAVERSLPPEVVRARYATVDIGILFGANGKPLDKNLLPCVTLNLFSDVTYTGIVTRVQKVRWGVSWTGRLQGKQDGYFHLVVTDNVFIAHVASLEGVYEVAWAGDGLYQVVQIDQSKFLEDYPAAAQPNGQIRRGRTRMRIPVPSLTSWWLTPTTLASPKVVPQP
jgi:hypothetical protein